MKAPLEIRNGIELWDADGAFVAKAYNGETALLLQALADQTNAAAICFIHEHWQGIVKQSQEELKEARAHAGLLSRMLRRYRYRVRELKGEN